MMKSILSGYHACEWSNVYESLVLTIVDHQKQEETYEWHHYVLLHHGHPAFSLVYEYCTQPHKGVKF
jgi:hypothetical protein